MHSGKSEQTWQVSAAALKENQQVMAIHLGMNNTGDGGAEAWEFRWVFVVIFFLDVFGLLAGGLKRFFERDENCSEQALAEMLHKNSRIK